MGKIIQTNPQLSRYYWKAKKEYFKDTPPSKNYLKKCMGVRDQIKELHYSLQRYYLSHNGKLNSLVNQGIPLDACNILEGRLNEKVGKPVKKEKKDKIKESFSPLVIKLSHEFRIKK